MCTSTRPQIELAMPSQPRICDIGSSTTWNGMNMPNSMSANISSLPLKRHFDST